MSFSSVRRPIPVIADDHKRDRQFINATLKGMGYPSANLMESAKEAFTLIKSGVGDILFVNMENHFFPGMEVVKRIKDDPKTKHIPIFLTGFLSDKDQVAYAKTSGMDSLIVKPLTQKKLTDQLKRVGDALLKDVRKWRKQQEKEIGKLDYDLKEEEAEKKMLYMETISQLEQMQISFPWHDAVFSECAKVLIRMGSDNKAIPFVQHATELNPNSPIPLGLLSDIFARKGDYQRAIRFAKRSVVVKGSPKAYCKLGELEMKVGLFNDAIKTLSHSIMIIESDNEMDEPKNQTLSNGFNMRGQAYQEKGDKENNDHMRKNAINDFKRSVELNPAYIAANYNLMVAYKKIGKAKDALKVLGRIKRLESNNADDWIQLAEAYYRDNELSKVKFALQKVLELEKGNMRYHKKVSQLYVEFGMMDKAETLLKVAQKANPGDVNSYNHLGIIYRRQGKLDKAIKQYEKALEFDPDVAVIWLNLGRAFLASGNKEEGIKMFKKSLELDPELDEAKKAREEALQE